MSLVYILQRGAFIFLASTKLQTGNMLSIQCHVRDNEGLIKKILEIK